MAQGTTARPTADSPQAAAPDLEDGGGALRWRWVVPIVATALVLGPLGWLWLSSLMPEAYSMAGMGRPDAGGGVALHSTHEGGGGTSVEQLVADPARRPDVSVTLTARAQPFTLASGRRVDGFTLNGTSPGPTVRARVGHLVEVRLVNADVPEGITLHWHGIDVPNGADGVAGVTQDAVGVGRSYTYRFVADQAGTFWYHSHQVSHEQVRGGLLGAVVVLPAPGSSGEDVDVLALAHLYGGVRTTNGVEGDVHAAAAPGTTARVRVINTDNGPMSVWVAGAPFRVVAVDGHDWHDPTAVRDTSVLVTAGGRVDLAVTLPDGGAPVRVHVGGPAGVVLGTGSPAPVAQPRAQLDLLSYGTPAPLGFDPAAANRRFEYSIGRRPGFIDGRPGIFWTINGRLFPDVPMFMVARGDVVRMRIENHSGEVHPMHLHGHHAVVLSRDGVAATGGPWWVDSLNVENGASYEIALVADNPGLWMDHCHNLKHAAEGLVAHLAYAGVSSPFLVGGSAHNAPE